MSWTNVPAGKLMAKRVGSVDPSKFGLEEFELFSIPAFDSGEPEILPGSEIGSSKKSVAPNDVLLSRIVPHIRRCWVVPQAGARRQIASGEWITFRSDDIYPEYLKHFLTSDLFHRQFMQTVSGVGGSLLRARPSEVERIEIPLPPLKVQERIAAILDKADAVRRKRQQAIRLADQFLRAVFLDMFGDPVTNPKGWQQRELGELIRRGDRLNYGVVQPGEHVEGGVPLIRVGDFSERDIDVNTLKRVENGIDDKHRRSRLNGDEILIACVGSIGKVMLATPQMKGWNIVRAVTRIPLSEEVDREYVFRYLQSPSVQDYFVRETRTVSQPTLNVGLIAKTPILLPNAGMQLKFKAIAQKVAQIKAMHHTVSASDEVLFASLSQKAFAGEL